MTFLAMDGSGPDGNLFQVKTPLVIRSWMRLMIAIFSLNFNEFVLMVLLASGVPDSSGASASAGTTDLLVSYTDRIAFQDAGQSFGLAAAIAMVIFLLVGSFSLINPTLSRVKV